MCCTIGTKTVCYLVFLCRVPWVKDTEYPNTSRLKYSKGHKHVYLIIQTDKSRIEKKIVVLTYIFPFNSIFSINLIKTL